MEFTPEQLSSLIEALQKNDITSQVPLPQPDKDGNIPPRNYTLFEKRVLSYMKGNLPALGITRNMGNFSADYPVNLLMGADARYISDECMKIFSDEELTDAAAEQFLEMYGPQLELAMNNYCKATAKKQDDLTDEDIRLIVDRTADAINEVLTSVLMQGQQFTAINDATHTMQAQEDFANRFNVDAVNFHNQWTHCKTAVGEMLSLDMEKETKDGLAGEPLYDAAYEPDAVFQIMCASFCATLNDADLTLFRMREDGRTQAEIAEKLGYKSQGAVAKRLQRLKKRWDDFMDESEPESE